MGEGDASSEASTLDRFLDAGAPSSTPLTSMATASGNDARAVAQLDTAKVVVATVRNFPPAPLSCIYQGLRAAGFGMGIMSVYHSQPRICRQ